ncbi:MAG: hypothetical protein F4Y88_06610 [Chloroflexi bacterium]|nr:hypothetical protein [Chloroflexota bacterium]
METTDYFERIVRAKRPEARETAWIEQVMANPYSTENQPDGRLRQWGYIQEADKWLRVITEDDVVHNAFFDRGKLREWGRPTWN